MGDIRTTAGLLAAAVALVAGCGGKGAERREATSTVAPHIHGLQIDPDDGSVLLATHDGLLRAEPGAHRARRVGPRRDLVALEVTGAGNVIASGHVGPEKDARTSIGLIASHDSGRSWSSAGLEREADLHVLQSGNSLFYAYDYSSLRLLVTPDGGRSWERRVVPGIPRDLAVDPDDERHLLLVTERGTYRSRDAGRTWRATGRSSAPLRIVWTTGRTLYGVDEGGTLRRSRDAGRTWRTIGRPGGRLAEIAVDGEQILVARVDGTVLSSTDRGRSWSVLLRPA